MRSPLSTLWNCTCRSTT